MVLNKIKRKIKENKKSEKINGINLITYIDSKSESAKSELELNYV